MKIPENVGQWLVLVGGVIHGTGAKMIQARNDELAAELAAAVERGRAAVRHAYDLGRIHQETGVPGLGANELVERVAAMIEQAAGVDVDEHQGAGADVDEHQGAGADVDEHPDAAAAAPKLVRDVDPVTETSLSSPGAAAADHSAPPLVDVDEHQGAAL
jgi:hypothetical protein